MGKTRAYTVTIDIFSLDYDIRATSAKKAGEIALKRAFKTLSHNQEILEYEIGDIWEQKKDAHYYSLAEAEKDENVEK
jgi:hypothetical protein